MRLFCNMSKALTCLAKDEREIVLKMKKTCKLLFAVLAVTLSLSSYAQPEQNKIKGDACQKDTAGLYGVKEIKDEHWPSGHNAVLFNCDYLGPKLTVNDIVSKGWRVVAGGDSQIIIEKR